MRVWLLREEVFRWRWRTPGVDSRPALVYVQRRPMSGVGSRPVPTHAGGLCFFAGVLVDGKGGAL